MSRRKARSAPTNKASLFVEKNIPSAVVHSARLPSMSSDAPSPPSRQKIASRRAPAETAVDKTVVVEDHQVRSPTISGFNVPEELVRHYVEVLLILYTFDFETRCAGRVRRRH